MTIWPGEKLPLFGAVVEQGGVDQGALSSLSVDSGGGAVTIGSGDAFYVYSAPSKTLLPDDVIDACNWFIEAASGTAEVLIATGVDPGFSGSVVFAESAPFTIGSGVVEVPLPASERTYARLRADEDALLLRVAVMSGSVTLSQIRLQIEPPGGFKTPTGFVWSDWTAPPEVLIGARVGQTEITYSGEALQPSPYDQVQLTNDALGAVSPVQVDTEAVYGTGFDISGGFSALVDYPLTFPPTERAAVRYWSRERTAHWEERPDFRKLPEHFANDGVLGRDVVGTDPVEGVNYEFMPDITRSVGWDPFVLVPYGAYTETTHDDGPVTVGSPHGERFTLSGSILQSGDATLDLSQPINTNSLAGENWTVAGTIFFIPLAPGPGDMSLTLTTTLTSLTDLVEGAWNDAGPVSEINAPLAWFSTKKVGDYYLPTLPHIRLQMPLYRWKIPSYDATEPTRKPRFYVTYTEVDEHPVDVSHVVGIGKPATDASIFKVPTPLGTLRELRHGEKVSDVSVAYPLKVKLEDGSWTVVAGMTPDE